MEVKNNTPFEFIPVPNYDKEGFEVFTNIVKGTFSFLNGRSLEIAEDQIPINFADEFWGEPGESPVKCESDLAIFKPSADLIMTGFAYDPRGRKVKDVDVQFSVGSVAKRATVKAEEAMDKIPLYFLDHFGRERGLFKSKPKGDGFGFFPKQYPPRVDFAGTYDDRWQKERSPFLPEDFDYRFCQSAYPDLITGSYLRGTETVRALNVSPYGPITLRLPGISIDVETKFEKKSIKDKCNIDTLILDAEARRLFLFWRQMIPCHGMIKDIREFEINMSSPL
jgi:hypothetical protein